MTISHIKYISKNFFFKNFYFYIIVLRLFDKKFIIINYYMFL